MKNFVFSALIAVAALGWGSAHAGARPTDAVLESYLKIQQLLANDTLEGVPAEAAKIAKLTKDKGLRTPALSLSKDPNIEAAREDFKKLSAAMTDWAKKEKPAGLDRVSCPMAKASWLQKSGPIQNPYYGKKMLDCGEVQK